MALVKCRTVLVRLAAHGWAGAPRAPWPPSTPPPSSLAFLSQAPRHGANARALPVAVLGPRTSPVRRIYTAAHADRDLYGVLGLRNGASAGDIKRAYYELSKRHHPDVNAGSPASHEAFAAISDAYSVLGNRESRRKYDANRARAAATSGHSASSETASAAASYEQAQDEYFRRQEAAAEEDANHRQFVYNFDEHQRAHYYDTMRRRREAARNKKDRETDMGASRFHHMWRKYAVAGTAVMSLAIGSILVHFVQKARRGRLEGAAV